MKMISWNVNGFRACMNKGFMDAFESLDADLFCLQETKMQAGQINFEPKGYDHVFFHSAQKKGYSGTALISRLPIKSITTGIGIEEHDNEGRVITAELDQFYLVNCYTPNSQRGLLRLDYRMQWEDDFRAYLLALDAKKPVILCGDLNVAHQEIDIKNPKSNRESAGFTDQERAKFTEFLASGYTDSFRYFCPDAKGEYSWWSYMGNARERNTGWRLDYFCVSNQIVNKMESAAIHQEIYGSDHCPVELKINL